MTVSPEVLAASILVVDDLQADARLVASMLGGAGYSRVSSTNDSREVCALHRKNRYDLIILDLLMPEMDGFQVMEGLKEIERGYLPVLAVTADPDLMSRALETGARDYINKPLRTSELLSRVRNLVEVGLLMKERKDQAAALEQTLQERTARLWESAEIFRRFAAHVPEGLLIRGVDDRIVRYVNPSWHRITGLPLAVGDSTEQAFQAIHPQDRERVRAEIARHPVGGFDEQFRLASPGPEPRWAHARTFLIADADGQPHWVAAILEDVTARKKLEEESRLHAARLEAEVAERRQTEQALRESESRFRALVEQSIVGIYVVDEGRLTYANPRLCAMLGYTAEELNGMQNIELIVEEDRERLVENRRRRDAGDLSSLIATYRLRRRDGSILHLAVDGRVLEQKGRKVLFGIGQDITEHTLAAQALRESEEKYRMLWETTSDAVILMGDDMDVLYANPSVKRVFGYEPEEVEGRPIGVLQPERLREAHSRGMRRYLRTGVKRLDWSAVEVVGLHKDGHEFPVEIAFSHLNIGDKSIFAGFMRDITARKQAQAALEYANKRLRVLSQRVLDIQEEERRSLSLELHDDLGQSLIALKIGLHRLGLGLGLDAGKIALLGECVAVTGSIQERLRELAIQLHPPQLVQLGLHEALRGLVNRQREMTGLTIRYRSEGLGDERLPVAMEGACYRICQEALNNATRHAKGKVIEIEMTAQGGQLKLEIRDDGVGFDRRAQAEDVLASGSLGLISMEERARLAGGRLEIRTVPGSGTRVIAFFPLGDKVAEPARMDMATPAS